jgi:hypothetical protein
MSLPDQDHSLSTRFHKGKGSNSAEKIRRSTAKGWPAIGADFYVDSRCKAAQAGHCMTIRFR